MRKLLGPKKINNYDRQQIAKFMEQVKKQNINNLKAKPALLNSRMKEFILRSKSADIVEVKEDLSKSSFLLNLRKQSKLMNSDHLKSIGGSSMIMS